MLNCPHQRDTTAARQNQTPRRRHVGPFVRRVGEASLKFQY